jgi:hypothetical protein
MMLRKNRKHRGALKQGVFMETSELVGTLEAAQRYSTTPQTLRRRVLRGQLQTFVDPLDERRRLIRVADLEEMRRPRPAQVKNAATTAA